MQAERLKILLELLEQEPNEPFNIYAIAMEYMSNDPDKALSYLENLLENHPDYLPTYYHAGALYVEKQNFEKALATYEKGIALATSLQKNNALRELRGAYQMLIDEME
ncbi:MAG: tetratricopeptide repeat protein [Spirosomataceae bacterium]